MKTIATVSPAPAARILVATGLYLAVVAASVVLAVNDLVHGEGHLIWLGVAGLLAALIARGVIDQIFLLGALLGPRKAVLWEEDGALVHFSPMTGRVRLADIDAVTLVQRRDGFGRRLYVQIGAGRRAIRLLTDVCAESADEIVGRLRALS